MSKPSFSVILPVYKGDQAPHLAEALESLLSQSLPPAEIVLVEDGPLTAGLEDCLATYQVKMPNLRRVKRVENGGLSAALNTGIEAANYQWLARMDADDICDPQRFEIQFEYLDKHPEISLLGAWITEFEEEVAQPKHIRKLPEQHEAVAAYARYRCPFNHMTVLYKKEAVLDCGGYRDFGAVGDDYVLWVDFILKGYKVGNVPKSLVWARTGKDFFHRRRRGWKYFKQEWREINYFYKKGFINIGQYLLHFCVKFVVRLSPPFLVRGWYALLRKS